ncbi:hypothetical protein MPTK1_2g12410 [Marchantia polymorpha subsp. ruderalis]|uniref:Uncharacterized protein n=1 Tax=Marchantia polymorpha TaxID=3197 RepID=A0A2R6XB26_MARPO|nr:hypothetical protein MARPO_0026s0130 [Marchantia polymorpha]BBN02059.1 hypothetical protein Mp_2g12410 [Marchantia polymorpha subsp. ruderalis]|eukprot:PTQ43262.1 hypothetical protein MARPO_0026s0130 [Marchantia polymorpha]
MWTIQGNPACFSPMNSAVVYRPRVVSLCPTRQESRWEPLWSITRSHSAWRAGPPAVAGQSSSMMRTCRQCKQPFDPETNDPRACRFHTAHFGGETKRKFESVYTGGTMDTVGGGEIVEYWHCCGSKDRFDPGCEAAPHSSYDD